jgi:CTP:molybdopterin cytidylyltransferase MocA
MAPLVGGLGADEGINKLMDTHPVRWLDLPPEQYLDDIDTPADYLRAVSREMDQPDGGKNGLDRDSDLQ